MHWGDLVAAKVATHGQLVLGVDPAPEHAPHALSQSPGSFLRRYTELLMVAAPGLVGFVKFQSAFFEAFGSNGVAELARAIAARPRRPMHGPICPLPTRAVPTSKRIALR